MPGLMRMVNIVSIRSHRAEIDQCLRIIEKIDFLLDVQQIAVGVDQIEPLLDDLLNSVIESRECWRAISDKFLDMTLNIDSDKVEVLQYCMHTLRWAEVEKYARSRLASETAIGKQRLYERLIESFSDVWPERDLYSRYDAGSSH